MNARNGEKSKYSKKNKREFYTQINCNSIKK